MRNLLAWLVPLASCVGCTTFFIAMSLRAQWLARPVFTESLSMATVVGVGLLIATLIGIVVFSRVAERADRDAGRLGADEG